MDNKKIIFRFRTKFAFQQESFDYQNDTYLDIKKRLCQHFSQNGEDLEPKQFTLHIENIENPQILAAENTKIKDLKDIEQGDILVLKMKKEILVKVLDLESGLDHKIMVNTKKETYLDFLRQVSEKLGKNIQNFDLFLDIEKTQQLKEDHNSIINNILPFKHCLLLYADKQRLQYIPKDEKLKDKQDNNKDNQINQKLSLYEEMLLQQQQNGLDDEELLQQIQSEDVQEQYQDQFLDEYQNQNQIQKQNLHQQNKQLNKMEEEFNQYDYKDDKNAIKLNIRSKAQGQSYIYTNPQKETYKNFKNRLCQELELSENNITLHSEEVYNPELQFQDENIYLSQIEELSEAGNIIYVREKNQLLILVEFENQSGQKQYEFKRNSDTVRDFIEKIKSDISVMKQVKSENLSFDLLDQNQKNLEDFKQDCSSNMNRKLGQLQNYFYHGALFYVVNIQDKKADLFQVKVQIQDQGVKEENFKMSQQDNFEKLILKILDLNANYNLSDMVFYNSEFQIISEENYNQKLGELQELKNCNTIIVKFKNVRTFEFELPNQQIKILSLNPDETNLKQLKQLLADTISVDKSKISISLQPSQAKDIADQDENQLLSDIREFQIKCLYYLRLKKNQQENKKSSIFDFFSKQNSQKYIQKQNSKQMEIEQQQQNELIVIRFKSDQGLFKLENIDPTITTLRQLKDQIEFHHGWIDWSQNILLLEDSNDREIKIQDNDILQKIDDLENGSILKLKNKNISVLKVRYDGIIHNLKVDLKQLTNQKLINQIQDQLKLQGIYELNGIQIKDNNKIAQRELNIDPSSVQELQVKAIQQNQSSQKMEEEFNDYNSVEKQKSEQKLILRIKSQSQFILELNPLTATLQDVINDILIKENWKDQDINLYLEDDQNPIEYDRGIPLATLPDLENGSNILVKSKSLINIFYGLWGQKQDAFKKLEIDPSKKTYKSLKYQISHLMGVKPDFSSLYLNSLENQSLDKMVSQVYQKLKKQKKQQDIQESEFQIQQDFFQQEQPQNQQNHEQIQMDEEEEEEQKNQNNEETKSQQNENIFNQQFLNQPLFFQNDSSDSSEERLYQNNNNDDERNQDFQRQYDFFNNDFEEDDGSENDYNNDDDYHQNQQQIQRNLNFLQQQQQRNQRQDYRNNRFNPNSRNPLQNSRRNFRSRFNKEQEELDEFDLIKNYDFIKNGSYISVKDDSITLFLRNEDKKIIVNPLITTFKKLKQIVSKRFKIQQDYIQLMTNYTNGEILDYNDQTKLSNIKEIQDYSVINFSSSQLSLRVQVENEIDQYEFFSFDERKATFRDFKLLVAAWQALSDQDFDLYFEDSKNPQNLIKSDGEKLLKNYDFMKNLSMTTKIILVEKQNIQHKQQQQKYNDKSCRAIMNKQTNMINKYKQMFNYHRFNIKVDRDNFIQSIYASFMSPTLQPINQESFFSGQVNPSPQNMMCNNSNQNQILGQTLNVQFIQEHGLDYGGLTDDFFSTFATNITDSQITQEMVLIESNNTIHPTGMVHQNMPQYYRFLGRVLGSMFRHRRNLGVRLSPIFYKFIGLQSQQLDQVKVNIKSKEENNRLEEIKQKKIQEKCEQLGISVNDLDSDDDDIYELGDYFDISLNDLKDFDIKLYNSYNHYITEKEKINWDDQFLDFTITDQFTSQPIHLGKNPKQEVNKNNIVEYTTLSLEQILKVKEIKQIAIGFQDIVPAKVLTDIAQFKKWEHIADLLEGSNIEITVALLQNNVNYEGYTSKHPTIKMFWDVLENDFTEKQRRQLLYYITGKKKLPLQGFKAFKSPRLQRINITYDKNKTRLPEGHTCFHQLILPAYDNKGEMIKKLKTAMKQEAMYMI